MNVFVVHYNTVYDGEFSSSGVKGVFTDREEADRVAAASRDNCTEVTVEEFPVQTGESRAAR